MIMNKEFMDDKDVSEVVDEDVFDDDEFEDRLIVVLERVAVALEGINKMLSMGVKTKK